VGLGLSTRVRVRTMAAPTTAPSGSTIRRNRERCSCLLTVEDLRRFVVSFVGTGLWEAREQNGGGVQDLGHRPTAPYLSPEGIEGLRLPASFTSPAST